MNMAIDTRNVKHDGGSALLIVLGVIFIVSLVVASMVTVGRQQVYSTNRSGNYVRAQLIAEAGANAAYNLIKTNFAACTNAANFPLTAFQGGTYDATVSLVDSNKASIVSVGIYSSVRARSVMSVQNRPNSITFTDSSQPTDVAYGYVIVSGGDLTWAGNVDFQTSNGWMHANGYFLANGANTLHANVSSCVDIGMVGGANIDGNARAPSIHGGTVSGQSTITNVPVVSLPNIDLTPYYNCAASNGQVFSSSQSLSGTVTPKGGIMWVNGDITFAAGKYTGCFIATGSLTIKCAGANDVVEHVKVAQYPAFVARDGSMLIKQAKLFKFNGLIYVKNGTFDKSGNGDVIGVGTILTAGTFSKNGGWSALIYQNSGPVPPGGYTRTLTADKVVVMGWLD